MSRVCAFCSNRAGSREHVWPDWLARREDIREALPHVFAEQVGRGAPTAITRQYDDQPYKLTTGYVCEACNHGWMSALEHAVERIMSGMLDGRGRELHRGEQATLAAWAFKTAVVFDHVVKPHAWVVPREHAHALRETGAPPPGTRIWMASYDATNVGICCTAALSAALEGQRYDPHIRNVYVRTFTIGTVVFQVFGTTNPGLAEMTVAAWPEPNIHQLWPYADTFTWRPRPAMNDVVVVAFSESIPAALSAGSRHVDP